MPPTIQRRLATLERQLQKYLAQTLPPARSSVQAKRRQTLRRRIIEDNVRRQRALRTVGHERGWHAVTLTAKDLQRVAQLVLDLERGA